MSNDKSKKRIIINLFSKNYNVQISKKDMEKIIADAIVEADKIKKERYKQKKNKFFKKLGAKKCKSPIGQFFNDLWVLIRLLFIKEKDVEDDYTSIAFLKLFLSLFWGGIWLVSLVAFSVLILAGFFPQIVVKPYILSKLGPVNCIIWSFIAFVFWRMSRIARIETEKMENKENLFAIFASITAFVSALVTVISLFG